MKPYRILYHHRIRADDGQAVHVREMIGALRRLGHEVRECALVPKAGDPVAAGTAGGGGFWRRLQLPRVATECVEILYSGRGASMLKRAAREFRPDFLYERHALHCRSGLDAARSLGLPVLLEVNSPLCDEMEHLGLLHFAHRARRTERAVFAGVDRVLPVSDVLAERVIALGAPRDRVRVIRNGADPERHGAEATAQGRDLRTGLGMTNGQLVLGFIGYMRPWHRLELVLDAMARFGDPGVHLILAGDGPALPDLLARVESLGLRDRVHPLGVVARDRLAGVCAAFDAALVPAINDYASPLKVFDSLGAGIPTMALDQPNIRELITDGETGILFEAGDPASLAARLAEFAADRDRLRAIGAAGRAALLANRWTWQGSAQRVIDAFEDIA